MDDDQEYLYDSGKLHMNCHRRTATNFFGSYSDTQTLIFSMDWLKGEGKPLDLTIKYKTGWWFGTFFIFPYIGNNHPNWLIFFRGVAQPPTRRGSVHFPWNPTWILLGRFNARFFFESFCWGSRSNFAWEEENRGTAVDGVSPSFGCLKRWEIPQPPAFILKSNLQFFWVTTLMQVLHLHDPQCEGLYLYFVLFSELLQPTRGKSWVLKDIWYSYLVISAFYLYVHPMNYFDRSTINSIVMVAINQLG